ncbi:hypothetical protein ScPMuIL_006876 [Solemya velum]
MEGLPQNELTCFMKGEDVMRHIPGVWNVTWSDMFIETTFMRYGNGKRGIIDVTSKQETPKTLEATLLYSHTVKHILSMQFRIVNNERLYEDLIIDKKEDGEKGEQLYTFSSPPVAPGESTRPDVVVKFQAVSWAHTSIGSEFVALNSGLPLSFVRRRIKAKFKNLFENSFIFLARNREVLKNKEDVTSLFDILPKLPLGKPYKNFQFPDVHYRRIHVNYDGKRYPIMVACVVFLFEQSRVSHWNARELKEQLSAKDLQGFSFIPTDIMSWKESLVERRATTLHMLAADKKKTTQDFESAIQQLTDVTAVGDLTDERSASPLHYAAENGHLDRCELIILILGKEHIYIQDINKKTPLHCAIYRKRLDVVAYLLQLDPDLYCMDIYDNCCFELLVSLSEKDTCAILPKLNAKCLEDMFALHLTCFSLRRKDPKKEIRKQIVRSARVFARNIVIMDKCFELGRSLIHLTVDLSDRKIIEILLRKGYSALQKDCVGYLPLHYACQTGKIHILPVLYDDAIDDSDICRGIRLALRNKKYNICESLSALRQKITFDEVTMRYILNVLDKNIDICGLQILPLLHDHTSLLDTFLGDSARRGLQDVVGMLLKLGANINTQDLMGRSALHECVQTGQLQTVELLVQRGINLNLTDWRGSTALHYACATGNIPLTEFLIGQANVSLNSQDCRGRTPLLVAMDRKRNDLVEVMVGKHLSKLKPFLVDFNGFNCLHYCSDLRSNTATLVLDSLPKDWKVESSAHRARRPLSITKDMVLAWYRGDSDILLPVESSEKKRVLNPREESPFEPPAKTMWSDRNDMLKGLVHESTVKRKMGTKPFTFHDTIRDEVDPIHVAIRGYSPAVVKKLVKMRKDSLRSRDFLGRTPTEVAIDRFSVEMLKCVWPDELDIPPEVLMYRAVSPTTKTATDTDSRYKVVDFLLSKNVPSNKKVSDLTIDGLYQQDMKAFMPIEIAAKRNEVNIVKLILAKSTDPTEGFALHFALHGGHAKMLDTLLTATKGKTKESNRDDTPHAARLGMGLIDVACSSPKIKLSMLQTLVRLRPDVLSAKKMLTKHLLEKERPGFQFGFPSPFFSRSCKTPLSKLFHRLLNSFQSDKKKVEEIACFLVQSKIYLKNVRETKKSYINAGCEAFLWAIYSHCWNAADALVKACAADMWEYGLSEDSGKEVKEMHKVKSVFTLKTDSFLKFAIGIMCVENAPRNLIASFLRSGRTTIDSKNIENIIISLKEIDSDEKYGVSKISDPLLKILVCSSVLISTSENAIKGLKNLLSATPMIYPHLWVAWRARYKEIPDTTQQTRFYLTALRIVWFEKSPDIPLLHVACFSGKVEIMRGILGAEIPVDINTSIDKYGSCLDVAAAGGNLDMVKLLLDRGAVPSPDTLVACVAGESYYGDEGLFEVLRFDMRPSPAVMAATKLKMAKELFNKPDVRVHHQPKDRQSAVEICMNQRLWKVLDLIVAKPIKNFYHLLGEDRSCLSSFFEFAPEATCSHVLRCLSLNVDNTPKIFDIWGNVILNAAKNESEGVFTAAFGVQDSIDWGEHRSTVLFRTDSHARNAFHHLARLGHVRGLDLILRKANTIGIESLVTPCINDEDKSRATPLWYAMANRKWEVAILLLLNGAYAVTKRSVPDFCQRRTVRCLGETDQLTEHTLTKYPKRSYPDIHNSSEQLEQCFNSEKHISRKRMQEIARRRKKCHIKEADKAKNRTRTKISKEEKRFRYVLHLATMAMHNETTILSIACCVADETLVDDILKACPTMLETRDSKNRPAYTYAIANGSVAIQNKVRCQISQREIGECLEMFLWNLIQVKNLEADIIFTLRGIVSFAQDNLGIPSSTWNPQSFGELDLKRDYRVQGLFSNETENEGVSKLADISSKIRQICELRFPALVKTSLAKEKQLKLRLTDILKTMDPQKLDEAALFLLAVVGEPWAIESLAEALGFHDGCSILNSVFPLGMSFLDLLLLGQRTPQYAKRVGKSQMIRAVKILCANIPIEAKPETLQIAARKDLWGPLSEIVGNTFHDGTDIDQTWQYIVYLSCRKGEIDFVKTLAETLDLSKRSSEVKIKILAGLSSACLHRKKDIVRFLLKQNIPCSQSVAETSGKEYLGKLYREGWLPLHYAVRGGDIDIVNMVIRTVSFQETTPSSSEMEELLQISARHIEIDILHRLVKYDHDSRLDICTRQLYGTLFCLAASKGNEKLCLEMIEDREFDILASTGNDQNALHYAAIHGMQDLALAITQRSPNSARMDDSHNMSPIDYACAMGNTFCFEMQNYEGKRFGDDNELECFGWFKKLMSENFSIVGENTESVGSRRLSPLYINGMLQRSDDAAASIALSAGQFSLLTLIKKGDVQPFLNTASLNGCLRFLETFVNIIEKAGGGALDWLNTAVDWTTPLEHAIRGQHIECVKFILSKNVDTTVLSKRDNVLHVAVMTGNVEIVRLLLSSVDPGLSKALGGCNSSPEAYAAALGFHEILSVLVPGSTVHTQEHSGHMKTDYSCVECLLDCCIGWSKTYHKTYEKPAGGLRPLYTNEQALIRGGVQRSLRDFLDEPTIIHQLETLIQWCGPQTDHEILKSAMVAMGYDSEKVTAPAYILSLWELDKTIHKLLSKGFVADALDVLKRNFETDPGIETNALFIAAVYGTTDIFTGLSGVNGVVDHMKKLETVGDHKASLFETALAFGHIETANVISTLSGPTITCMLEEIQEVVPPTLQWLSDLSSPGNEAWHDSFIDTNSRLNDADVWLIASKKHEEISKIQTNLKSANLRPTICNERKITFDVDSFRKHKCLSKFSKMDIDAFVSSSAIYGRISDLLSDQDMRLSSARLIQVRCSPDGASEQPKTFMDSSDTLNDVVRLTLVNKSLVVLQDQSLKLKAMEVEQKEKIMKDVIPTIEYLVS